MAKELPYYRFYPSEWLEGSITLEKPQTQALFILICAWYWKKDCKIDLNFIYKRIPWTKARLNQSLTDLKEANIIKVDENQNVNIDFLNEQYQTLLSKHQKLSEAGRKGGLKPGLSYKDKIDKDKDIYRSQEENFYKFKIQAKKEALAKSQHLQSAFISFMVHREKFNKSLDKKAAQLIYTELENISATPRDAIAILNQAIRGGYTDIRPLKA